MQWNGGCSLKSVMGDSSREVLCIMVLCAFASRYGLLLGEYHPVVCAFFVKTVVGTPSERNHFPMWFVVCGLWFLAPLISALYPLSIHYYFFFCFLSFPN